MIIHFKPKTSVFGCNWPIVTIGLTHHAQRLARVSEAQPHRLQIRRLQIQRLQLAPLPAPVGLVPASPTDPCDDD